MVRFLIYLFPAVMDMIAASFLFICPMRLSNSGAPPLAVAGVITLWAATYMVTCQLVGRFVTPANAAWMLVGSGLAAAGCSAAMVLFPAIGAIYYLMAIVGVILAFFFVPFQVFMKAVEHGKPEGVVRSASLYTFSWSMGFAAGPFVAGMLWDVGWQWCHLGNVLGGVAVAGGVVLLRHLAHHQPAAMSHPTGERIDPPALPDRATLPDLAWLAWIAGGVGFLVQSLIRGVLPTTCKEIDIPESTQGTTLALISVTQGLVALTFLRSRRWMYRAAPVGMFGLIGLAGLLLFGSASRTWTLYCAAICTGVYSGGICFYLVYHSLVHPTRSARYVAVNESVVGICGIIGPALGGMLASADPLSAPYFAAGALIAIAAVLQVTVHRLGPALKR